MFASDADGNSIIFTEETLRMFKHVFRRLCCNLYRVRDNFSCNHLCIWYSLGLLSGCGLVVLAADSLFVFQIPQLLSSPSFFRLLFINSIPVLAVFTLIKFSLRGMLKLVAFFQAFFHLHLNPMPDNHYLHITLT